MFLHCHQTLHDSSAQSPFLHLRCLLIFQCLQLHLNAADSSASNDASRPTSAQLCFQFAFTYLRLSNLIQMLSSDLRALYKLCILLHRIHLSFSLNLSWTRASNSSSRFLALANCIERVCSEPQSSHIRTGKIRRVRELIRARARVPTNALVGSGAGTLRSRHALRRYVTFLQRVQTGSCIGFLPDAEPQTSLPNQFEQRSWNLSKLGFRNHRDLRAFTTHISNSRQ